MKRKSLLEHAIFKTYQNEFNSVVEIILENENNEELKLNEKQMLIKNLFDYLIEIENKEKDIQIANSFLRTPYTLGRKTKQIKTKSDYIKYHIESYQISIVGIFDRLLHLINFIYKLGLADKHVKKDIVCSNTKIPKKLVELINDFDKKIADIRKSQNGAKHKEKIYLPELYNADILYFTLKQWQEIKVKKIKTPFSWTKEEEVKLKKNSDFYYALFLKKEQEKIKFINEYINDYINKFLDILEIEFKKHI